jgi:hypothetical protein
MPGSPEDPNLERLRELQTLPEYVFSSQVPLFGPLIARFRDFWNSIATKWYVGPLIRQQSEFNRVAADRFEAEAVGLTEHATSLADHEAWLKDLAGRLIDQDREHSALTHDLGEAAAQLVQLNRLLVSLDQRVASLEEGAGPDRERA